MPLMTRSSATSLDCLARHHANCSARAGESSKVSHPHTRNPFSPATTPTHRPQITLSDNPSPSIQAQLHLTNLLIHILHELNDEIHQLVLEHRLCVGVCDEEGDVVAWYGLATEDNEAVGALGHEAGELVSEYVLDVVGLLDADGEAERVD